MNKGRILPGKTQKSGKESTPYGQSQRPDRSYSNGFMARNQGAILGGCEYGDPTADKAPRLCRGAMEEELVAHLQASWYQRHPDRQGYRNGYRKRNLFTRWGLLEELRVPRDRDGRFTPPVLEGYQRRQEEVNVAIQELFLRGISTRQVQAVVQPLMGEGVSAQTVSRICRSLDREVARYHRRTLVDGYVYLLLDGVVLKVKSPTGVKKRLLLCAYGVTASGTRELLSFRQATAESEAQWEAFLQDLYERGLVGNSLRLITIDGCPGLRRALELVYPYVPVQRCWAHKLRNVAAKLPRRYQKACLAEAKEIYQASSQRQAVARFRDWASRWQHVAPKAVHCIEEDLEELLNFMACPPAHWRKVRTTNAIERAFREVRRRTRPMSCPDLSGR